MSNYNSNYLSEFEQEFAGEYSNEMEYENYNSEFENQESEFESEFENEFQNESNLYNEYESNQEMEFNGEISNESDREMEFTNRLYEALNNETLNEFETETEINRVFHEMENEFFWGAIKRGLKNLNFKKILNIASKLIKNPLIQKAISFVPFAGPAVSTAMGIAGKFMNEFETPGKITEQDALKAVQVAKGTYQNLAQNATQMASVTNQNQAVGLAKSAIQNAVRKVSSFKGKRRRVIQVSPNAIVVVRRGKVVIYQ